MIQQELKKLSRTDLIEMMLNLSREKLADRMIKVESAGSLAEAALTLSGVFEAAQNAAEVYLENLRQRSEQQDLICAQMELQTREKCDRMMEAAKKQVEDYLQKANRQLREFNDTYTWKAELPDEMAQDQK